MKRPSRIIVLGSLNVDYIARVDRLPQAGQTAGAYALERRFGGKGANQAVAAARQGAKVCMIGCLGDDDVATAYRKHLKREGIDDRGIRRVKAIHTGAALIAVDDRAENLIIVAPQANGRLTPAMVLARRKLITGADALLLQWETPQRAIEQAIRLANRAQVPVVMNPSPIRKGFKWGEWRIDTLIVNEGEAAAIFGASSLKQIRGLALKLGRWGVSMLVVTRGAKATLLIDQTGMKTAAAVRIKPVDTVGAGDAFAGAYTVYRAEGLAPLQAVRRANVAGALATLKSGAQEAIPTRRQLEAAMNRAGVKG